MCWMYDLREWWMNGEWMMYIFTVVHTICVYGGCKYCTSMCIPTHPYDQLYYIKLIINFDQNQFLQTIISTRFQIFVYKTISNHDILIFFLILATDINMNTDTVLISKFWNTFLYNGIITGIHIRIHYR